MHFISGQYSISEDQVLTGLAVQLGLVHPLDQIRDALDAPVHLEVASDEELPGLVDHLDIYIYIAFLFCSEESDVMTVRNEIQVSEVGMSR
jgi:hypothetical protein